MIRTLHIFSPTFGRRFSGHDRRWLRQFERWHDDRVRHSLLIPDRNGASLLPASMTANSSAWVERSFERVTRRQRGQWAVRVLWNLIKHRNEYDILHVHALLWGGLLSAPLANVLTRPCLYEISLMGSDNPSALVRENLRQVKIWSFRRYDAILTTSKAARDDCRRFGFAASDVKLNPNPVNTDLFAPPASVQERALLRSNLSIPVGEPVMLFVGSIKYRKGVDVLIEAFVELAEKYSDLRLILLGPLSHEASPGVEDAFVQEIHEQLSRNDMSDRVRFVGRVDDDRLLADYYRASDVMAFPSRAEGMPNALLEGMSSGLPVVSSDLPGVTSMIIREGENGFLIAQDDARALAKKASILIEDCKMRERVGKNARRFVIEHHNFERWQDRMVQIYASMRQG